MDIATTATTTLAVIELKSLHTGTESWVIGLAIASLVVSSITLGIFGFILWSQIGATNAARDTADVALQQSSLAIWQFELAGPHVTVSIDDWPVTQLAFKNIGGRSAKSVQVVAWIRFPELPMQWSHTKQEFDLAPSEPAELTVNPDGWPNEEAKRRYLDGEFEGAWIFAEVRYGDQLGDELRWYRNYSIYRVDMTNKPKLKWKIRGGENRVASEPLEWPADKTGFDIPIPKT